MNWELIHRFLDALDGAANANAFWLELGIPEESMALDALLLYHLRSGNFHFELVKQDIIRDWNNYSEVIFPRHADLPVVLPRPGNTWSGQESINAQPIERDQVEALLMDLLTGQKKFFSKSTSGTPLEWEPAADLVEALLEMLSKEDPDWTAHRIDPDFLNLMNVYYDSGYVKLGYFEGRGRDLALAVKADGSLYIILTNGYG